MIITPLPLSTLGEAALTLARECGFAVFPLRAGSKVPLMNGGFYNATTDLEQVGRWWRKWPHANIGIATGPVSGLLVVDLDPKNGSVASEQELHREHKVFPLTRMARSGSGVGMHLYYRYPEKTPGGRPIGCSTGLHGKYPGIDIRAQGGYIVAPPSIHPQSGAAYAWLNQIEEIAHSPAWLDYLAAKELVLPEPEQQRREPIETTPSPDFVPPEEFFLTRALQGAYAGNRNNMGYWLACRLYENKVSENEAASIMRAYANRCGKGSHAYTQEEALNSLIAAYHPREKRRAG